MIDVLYHRAKFGGARISPAAGGGAKTLTLLANVRYMLSSVRLSPVVCLSVVNACAP